MYIDDQTYQSGGKTYRRVLLRKGKRVNGKVVIDTVANLSSCSDKEIAAIDIALKNKDRLPYLGNLVKSKTENGKLYAPVIVLYRIAQIFGMPKLFSGSINAVVALWLIFARIINQGSRLSAVRLAKIHAGCEIIGINKLNEDLAYSAMDWLAENKETIEKRLFENWKKRTHSQTHKSIFLYDVSSTYIEGEHNEIAEYG